MYIKKVWIFVLLAGLFNCSLDSFEQEPRKARELPEEMHGYIGEFAFREALDFWAARAQQNAPQTSQYNFPGILLPHLPAEPTYIHHSASSAYVVTQQVMSREAEKLSIWNAQNGTLLHAIMIPIETVLGASLSPNGKILALGRSDGTLQFISVYDDALLKSIKIGSQPLKKLTFSMQGNLIAIAEEQNPQTQISNIYMYDLATERIIFAIPYEGYVSSIAINHDTSHFALYDGMNNRLLMLKTETGNIIHNLNWAPNLNIFGFSSNLTKILFKELADQSNSIYLFDLQHQQAILILSGSTTDIDSAQISANNRIVVSAAEDSTVRIWHLYPENWIKALESLSFQAKILLQQAFEAFQKKEPLYLLEQQENIALIHEIDAKFNNMITKTIRIIDDPLYLINWEYNPEAPNMPMEQ